MPEAAAIAQFERRLVELGCPAAKLRQEVRELADHHEDLVQAAKEEGLSEVDAAARADDQLGEPVTLAERAAAALRQSSWWGRHPFVAFFLLPPVAVFAAVCLALALDFLFSRLYFPPAIFSVLADEPPDLKFLQFALVDTSYAAIALTAMLFCVAANRSASGLRCALGATVACSLFSFFVSLHVEPHTLAYGCNFPVTQPRDWMPVILPLVVGAAAWLRHRLWLGRFAPIPVPGPPGSRLVRRKYEIPRTEWLTPTSATALLLLLGFIAVVRTVRAEVMQRQVRQEELVTKIWPGERAVVVRRLNDRPLAPGMVRAVPVSLKGVVNAALTNSLAGAGDTNQNTLAQLPKGTHLFAGIPFDVEGRVQLQGRSLLGENPTLPVRAKNIAIGRLCDRIFLLHGASGLTAPMAGTNVAKLILHYADGSRANLAIVAGKDVLDWWGPIYETGAEAGSARLTSAATELAWVGFNPAIEQREPELSLRVYRSVFLNPHPDREIKSVDYVSAAGEAAPFLLGLTVE